MATVRTPTSPAGPAHQGCMMCRRDLCGAAFDEIAAHVGAPSAQRIRPPIHLDAQRCRLRLTEREMGRRWGGHAAPDRGNPLMRKDRVTGCYSIRPLQTRWQSSRTLRRNAASRHRAFPSSGKVSTGIAFIEPCPRWREQFSERPGLVIKVTP